MIKSVTVPAFLLIVLLSTPPVFGQAAVLEDEDPITTLVELQIELAGLNARVDSLDEQITLLRARDREFNRKYPDSIHFETIILLTTSYTLKEVYLEKVGTLVEESILPLLSELDTQYPEGRIMERVQAIRREE